MTTGARQPASSGSIVAASQMIAIGDSPAFIPAAPGTQPQTNIPIQLYIVFPYTVLPLGYDGWEIGMMGRPTCCSAMAIRRRRPKPFGWRPQAKAAAFGTAIISPTRNGGKSPPSVLLLALIRQGCAPLRLIHSTAFYP